MRILTNESRYTSEGIETFITRVYERTRKHFNHGWYGWKDLEVVIRHSSSFGRFKLQEGWTEYPREVYWDMFVGDCFQLGDAALYLSMIFYFRMFPTKVEAAPIDCSWIYNHFPNGLPLKPFSEEVL